MHMDIHVYPYVYMGGARERLIEERENALLSRSHTLSYTPVDLPLYHIYAELAERHTATADRAEAEQSAVARCIERERAPSQQLR